MLANQNVHKNDLIYICTPTDGKPITPKKGAKHMNQIDLQEGKKQPRKK